MPSFSDTVAKVWGTHTVKAGFFWEWIRNAQPANGNTQRLPAGQYNGNPNTLRIQLCRPADGHPELVQ